MWSNLYKKKNKKFDWFIFGTIHIYIYLLEFWVVYMKIWQDINIKKIESNISNNKEPKSTLKHWITDKNTYILGHVNVNLLFQI